MDTCISDSGDQAGGGGLIGSCSDDAATDQDVVPPVLWPAGRFDARSGAWSSHLKGTRAVRLALIDIGHALLIMGDGNDEASRGSSPRGI